MSWFGQQKKPKKREPIKREKPVKHVFSASHTVCFPLTNPKTREVVWHMGEIVAILPERDPKEKPRKALVALFELTDPNLPVRTIEGWETDAPPYFDMPREVRILDRLLSQVVWNDKKLAARVEVDLENMCVAMHVPFMKFFLSKVQRWDLSPYNMHKWSS